VTLAIAVLTREYALMATDRRITTTHASGRSATYEDSDTKTAILDGRYLTGFAGLGRVPSRDIDPVTKLPKRQRLESWLANQLEGVESAQYIDAVATAIGVACETSGHDKPHKFICIGYEQEAMDLNPVALTIENRRAAPYSFYPYRHEFDGNAIVLSAGAVPDVDSFSHLNRLVSKYAHHYPLQPDIFTRHINRVFAATAAVDETVSSTLLLTTMPRRAIPVESAQGFMDCTQTYSMSDFYYFDHHDSKTGVSLPEQYGPAIVGAGSQMIGMTLVRGVQGELGPLEGI
jgi:hypothetical protein